jgi:hypothetical protein
MMACSLVQGKPTVNRGGIALGGVNARAKTTYLAGQDSMIIAKLQDSVTVVSAVHFGVFEFDHYSGARDGNSP